jgi:hypothetical protein
MKPDLTTGDRLRRLGSHLPGLESTGFSFGHWAPSTTREDGVIVLGWYEFSRDAEAFLADARQWVTPFDWPTWASSPEGHALLGHPEAVASATAEDLRKLLTTYIRSERFGDGTLANAFESGMLTAIVRRAAALAAERPAT